MSRARVLLLAMPAMLPAAGTIHAEVLMVAPFEGGLVELSWSTVQWPGEPGELAAGELGCDRLFGPETSPDGAAVALWAGSDSIDCLLLLTADGYDVLGPYAEAGLPSWDSSGGLWFTAEGELTHDCEPTGIALDTYGISVSPDGALVAYTDRDDRLMLLRTSDGQTEVLADDLRYYAPRFTDDGRVFAPSLDGGIRLFSEEGPVEVGGGEQPVWWPEKDMLLFIRTTDDGERILSSDIWGWTEEGGAGPLAETPDRLELFPAPAGDRVYYVDLVTGRSDYMETAPEEEPVTEVPLP